MCSQPETCSCLKPQPRWQWVLFLASFTIGEPHCRSWLQELFNPDPVCLRVLKSLSLPRHKLQMGGLSRPVASLPLSIFLYDSSLLVLFGGPVCVSAVFLFLLLLLCVCSKYVESKYGPLYRLTWKPGISEIVFLMGYIFVGKIKFGTDK